MTHGFLAWQQNGTAAAAGGALGAGSGTGSAGNAGGAGLDRLFFRRTPTRVRAACTSQWGQSQARAA